MWLLVTYDVNTETQAGQRRLRRVAQACLDHGQRVQKSVFECTLNRAQFEGLKRRLLKCIDQGQDSLRFYKMAENRPEMVEEFGVNHVVDFKGPLVI